MEIVDATVDGELRLVFHVQPDPPLPCRTDRLANTTLTHLTAIIDLCVTSAGDWSPSDFPGSGLDQRQLDVLQAELFNHRQHRDRHAGRP